MLQPRQIESINGMSEGRTSISSATNQPPLRGLRTVKAACLVGGLVSDGAQRTSNAALRSVRHLPAFLASYQWAASRARNSDQNTMADGNVVKG